MICIISSFLNSFRRRRLKKAVQRYKASPGPRQSITLARLLLKSGKGEKALKLLSESRRRFPKHRGISKLYRSQRTRQALRLLKRTKRLLKSESSLRLLGKACDLAAALGNFDKAATYAEEANRLYPNHWRTHLIHGKLYFHRYNATRADSDRELTLTHLNEAYELNSQNYDTLLLLALMLARTGDRKWAQKVAQFLLEVYPDDPKGTQLLGHIEQSLRQGTADSGDDSFEGLAASINAAMDNLREIEGAVGLFLFDQDGNMLDCFSEENDVFSFSERDEPLRAMIKTCRFDASRIGIGDLRSCMIYGEGWQVIIRSFDSMQIAGFFKSYPHGEALEQEIDVIVREAQMVE